MKIRNILSYTLVTGTLVTATVSLAGYKIYKVHVSNYNQNNFDLNKQTKTINYEFKPITLKQNNVDTLLKINDDNLINEHYNVSDLLDQADINMFGISTSIQPFWDQLRLAMMAKGEVHFTQFVYGDSRMSVDKEKFENWLHNMRAINLDKDKKSRVYNFNRFWTNKDFLIKSLRDVIVANPDKKINLWVSSAELNYIRQYLELAAFKNVKFLCLNEASSIISSYETRFINDIDDFNRKNQQISIEDIESGPTGWIPLSTVLDNVYFFFEDHDGVDKFKNKQLKRVYPYSVDKDWRIKNTFFQARDINKKRIPFSKDYYKISRQDWRVERDKVKQSQQLYANKPKIIFLGSGGDVKIEKDLLAHVINKYQDQYNIYYKGHPNFSVIDKWIENVVNKNKIIEYTDRIHTTNFNNPINLNTSLKPGNFVTILNNQIPSEELTTNHANDEGNEKGLWFEKWATVDMNTGALKAILDISGKNTTADLIFTGISIRDQEGKKIIAWRAASPISEIDDPVNNELWNEYVLKQAEIFKTKNN
ncbi:hypothetical protein EG856_02120 [Mycoplasmopsis phocirhinis]|uniref:Uncharacterized protein n=1 Tax=Mycoplasmopsis phocirhinis TaxID=142650 RepID=A0A4P6MNT0_9BACT|nr:hypothetical protein [Mycoplasmopsis phocirhinis]QBF34703.1 hypothetical protein EG856_02120 [Mycoplasmopsis phocirhinis]